MSPTPTRRLIEQGLPDLESWVRSRRPNTAWRKIATELLALTGIDVTAETLRQWFPDRQPQDAA